VAKVQLNNHFLFENDYTQFDSTISSHALKAEFDIYDAFGVKCCKLPMLNNPMINWAKYVLNSQLYTIGYDGFGNLYELEGNRKSGDPNTSCGNTIVNGLANAYVFACELAK
jgi:hypothetical protein